MASVEIGLSRAPTYQGNPCLRQHTLRYRNGGECVECTKVRGRAVRSARRPASPKPTRTKDTVLAEAAWQAIIKNRGARSHIADEFCLRSQTVDKWTRVPLDYVFALAAMFEVAPETLRPDFFRHDPLRRAALVPSPRLVPAITEQKATA